MKLGRGAVIVILCAVVVLAVLAVVLLVPRRTEGTPKPKGNRVVGEGIALEDVTEFYYPLSSSTNPPEYQRYRFYREAGEYRFFHETREGDHWPLRPEDATRTGERTLTEEEWSAFFDSLRGGTVEKRTESADSGGSGPWLYLYWTGDKDKYQEYTFPDLAARRAFVAMCEALRETA
jgi:hypothetical protein